MVTYLPAKGFARILQRIDQDAASLGLHGGTFNTLHHFVNRLEIRGWATPPEGPLLVAANHPGGTDPFVMASAINRRNLFILSQNHIIFDALPNLKKYLIITAEDRSDGHIAIRKMLTRLKEGDSLLVYPGGELELDPALFPGSSNLLRDWSRSISLVLRRIPDAIVQPVILRGTISQQAWKSRLASMARSATTRLQIAMILQIAVQQLKHDAYPVETILIKGKPMQARELDVNLDPDSIHRALMGVVSEMVRSNPLQYPLLEEIVPAR